MCSNIFYPSLICILTLVGMPLMIQHAVVVLMNLLWLADKSAAYAMYMQKLLLDKSNFW